MNARQRPRRAPRKRGEAYKGRRKQALLEAGIVAPDTAQVRPMDPSTSLESQYQLAGCSPGNFECPFVVDGKVRSDLATSIGSNSYIQTVTPNATDYMVICWYPSLGQTVLNASGLYMSLIGPAGTVSTIDLTTGAVGSVPVWGVTGGFADKFTPFHSSLEIILRATAVTVAGSVWIGSFTWSNITQNLMTVPFLRSRAKEYDLKESCRFSLRNSIQERALIDASGTAAVADSLAFSERVAYALISPGAFLNITTGAPTPFTIDTTIRANYVFAPDVAIPMLSRMTGARFSGHASPTPAEAALCDELEDAISPYPEIVPNDIVDEISRALHLAARGKKSDNHPLAKLSTKWSKKDNFTWTGSAGHWVTDTLKDQIENYQDLTSLVGILEWSPTREAASCDLERLNPDILDLYDEFDDTRQRLIDVLKESAQKETEIRERIKKLETRQHTKHGKTLSQYFFDDDWRSYDYVRSRLDQLSLPEAKSVTTIFTVPESRDKSKSLNRK